MIAKGESNNILIEFVTINAGSGSEGNNLLWQVPHPSGSAFMVRVEPHKVESAAKLPEN
jgi:hypothetical protein